MKRQDFHLDGGPVVSIPIPNALTIDVEDYFHVAALAPSISRDSWDGREPRVVGNTQKLLA